MCTLVKMSIVLCFTLILVQVITAAENDSPVLMWSSEPLLDKMPEAESLDSVQTAAFHDTYLAPLLKDSKHSVVAFLQDKLHVDDFTRHADVYASSSTGGAFKNIKQLMEDNFSLEIPQVVKPHLALDKVKNSFNGNVHTIGSLGELEQLQLGSGKQFLLIVNLKSLSNAIDEEKLISENDDLIGKMMQHLGKNGIKCTALFTGKTSGDGQFEDLELHAGRHLLADASNGTSGVLMNTSGVFVYLRHVIVCLKKDSTPGRQVRLTPVLTVNDAEVTKSNGTATVVLNYKDVKANSSSSSDPYTISIVFNVIRRPYSWIIKNMTLSASGADFKIDNAVLENQGVDFTVPMPYSFHCSDLLMNVNALKGNMSALKGSYVRLGGFQMQVYDIQNDQFFLAQDCVGFFTSAIWMGLFPTIILLFILLSGVMMLLNLSVTDRFDDPKKKTITVNVSD